MGRYGGHRIPDEYSKDWANYSLGEYWDWWHLGHEDGVWETKLEYGLDTDKSSTPEDDRDSLRETVKRLNVENNSLKDLLAAQERVLKKLSEDQDKEQVRAEDIQLAQEVKGSIQV